MNGGSATTGAPPILQTPFGRNHRLRTQAQFTAVRSERRSRAGKYCVVAVGEARDGMIRAGFVISRRYSKKAVVRNRARRLFRESFRRLFPELQNVWITFIPRWRMQDAKLDDVLKEVRQHLRKLNVLKTGDK